MFHAILFDSELRKYLKNMKTKINFIEGLKRMTYLKKC